MNILLTDRGFSIAEFVDANGEPCSIQQSSAIDFPGDGTTPMPGASMLWLGKEMHRMHLDRDRVSALVVLMNRWLETGQLTT